jgi:predicted amidohydrolase
MQPLFALSREIGVGFCPGCAERAERAEEGGRRMRYNSAILVDRSGSMVGQYRKIHVPGHFQHEPWRKFQHLGKRCFTPGKGKLLYVDPNQLPLLAGRRVLVVDDAVSSETTMVSGLRLLERCGAEVVAIAVAMRQGTQWRDKLRNAAGQAIPVVAALDSPRMVRTPAGWVPEA